MNKTERQIVGQIKHLAHDKRGRLMKDDHIKWLETKFKEIGKLVDLLPGDVWERGDPVIENKKGVVTLKQKSK